MIQVALVGLMGAGKTTIGRLVATKTGRALVDADVAIEARTGQTVRELWEIGGEVAYRQMESAVVLDALAGDVPVVIATPGGAVLDSTVRDALDAAFVVWLRADPVTLAGRVKPGDHRPLLEDDPLEMLSVMSVDRAHLYDEVSDAVVDVDGIDPHTAADLVVDLLQRVAPDA